MKYHEKLRVLNKSYFNKIHIVLALWFTDMVFDTFEYELWTFFYSKS